MSVAEVPRDPGYDSPPDDYYDGPPFHRGDHVEIGEKMLAVLTGGGERVVFDDGALRRYDPARGLWARIEESEKSRTIQGFAGMEVENGKKTRPLKVQAGDVSGGIRLAHDAAERRGFFAEGPPGIAFANGFAVVGDNEKITLHEHDPENRATIGLPFDFDPCSPRPRWHRFLEEVFAGDDDADAKRSFLQDFAGVSFLGFAPRYQRAVVCLGTGANGKSVLLDVVARAFPDDARSAIAPQDWDDEYRLAMLAGKRLNALSELPENDILASEKFKAIISGDATTGRHIRQAPFMFRPKAGHLFAANELPGTTDLSDGFWRRLVVLRFGRTFAPEEQDAGLAAAIIATELPGVVAWALEGAARMLARGSYIVPGSSVDAVAEWRKGADSVALFFAERTEPLEALFCNDAKNGVGATKLYDEYRAWVPKVGMRQAGMGKFGKRAVQLGHAREHTDTGNFYMVRMKP